LELLLLLLVLMEIDRPPEIPSSTEFKLVFDLLDKNKDGFITEDDLSQSLADFCKVSLLSSQETHNMVKVCDKDHDGKLSMDDFCNFYNICMGYCPDESTSPSTASRPRRTKKYLRGFFDNSDLSSSRSQQSITSSDYNVSSSVDVKGASQSTLPTITSNRKSVSNSSSSNTSTPRSEVTPTTPTPNSNLSQNNPRKFSNSGNNETDRDRRNSGASLPIISTTDLFLLKDERQPQVSESERLKRAAHSVRILKEKQEQEKKEMNVLLNRTKQLENDFNEEKEHQQRREPQSSSEDEKNCISAENSSVIGVCWNVMMVGFDNVFAFLPRNASNDIVKVDLRKRELRLVIVPVAEEEDGREENEYENAVITPSIMNPDGSIEFHVKPTENFTHTWYNFTIYQREDVVAQSTNALIGTRKKIDVETEKLTKKMKHLLLKQNDSGAMGLETKLSGQIAKIQSKRDAYQSYIKTLPRETESM